MVFNENASFWAKSARDFDKQTSQDRDALVDRICSDIGQVDRVLDVGAGTGVVSRALARHVSQVDAVDLEPEMIAVARQNAMVSNLRNITFHTRSAYELCFSLRTFDAVVILNSLHVMKTPEVALREVHRVIKPSGLLVVPTYCHAETEENLKLYQQWASKSGHRSFHVFTCGDLCALITRCGFEVREKDVVEIRYEQQARGMILGYVVASPVFRQ